MKNREQILMSTAILLLSIVSISLVFRVNRLIKDVNYIEYIQKVDAEKTYERIGK